MSDQLPPHARAMLDALQREDSPDSAEQRRVKQQVFARLGLGAIGAATATASSLVSHAAATTGSTTASSTAVGAAATATSGASAGSPLGAAVGSAGVGTAGAGSAAAGAAAGTGITSLLAAKLGTTKLVLGLTTVLATAGGAALLSEAPFSETHLSEAVSSRAHSMEHRAASAPSAPSVAHDAIVSPTIVPHPPGLTQAHTMPEVDQDSPASPPSVIADVPSRAPESVTQSRPSGARNAPAWSLQEEAQLLGLAHQKISQGQPAAALTILAEHQQRFPRGTLALERQAAFAVARCLNGETQRGRAEAERFRRKYPTSPMVKRLESACQLSDP